MYILSHAITSSQEIQFVAQQTHQTCAQVFLKAAFLTKKRVNYSQLDLDNLRSFAVAACKSKNPDIIWQIAFVESGFEMRVIGIPGKGKLVGSAAENYLSKLNSPDNVDIGPIQINWKAHGFKSGFAPHLFFNGVFSLNYISSKIVPSLVKTCKGNWVNCYNSHNIKPGLIYRAKIDDADIVLRTKLLKIIDS